MSGMGGSETQSCALVVVVTGGNGPFVIEEKRWHRQEEHAALPMVGRCPGLHMTGADKLDVRWRQAGFVDEQGRSRVRTHLSVAQGWQS